MTDPQGSQSAAARDARIQAAFAHEQYDGLVLAARVRLIALVVIGIWISIENDYPRLIPYELVLIAFAIFGIAPLVLRRAGVIATWPLYLFSTLDILLLTAIVLVPNPFDQYRYPLGLQLRFGNEAYLFLFLAITLFTYSPRVVLWTGITAASVWSIGTAWIFLQPETIGTVREGMRSAHSLAQQMAVFSDPRRVNIGWWGRQVVLLLVVAGTLATAVWRSRRLVLRQAMAERERANLSRYFSPNMVDELSQSDEPLRATRTQNVAVLFVDIVGFTTLSARQTPEAVIQLLRQFHRRMARAVFDHAGTVDKYLGDGLMATFGTPRTGSSDATNALRCARAMVREMAAWNAQRAQQGESPIHIGIGVHYGAVVLGDVGDEQHLEFAVLGDTVNVASRLEELTRSLNTSLIVSDALIDGARTESRLADADLADLQSLAPQPIRGRDDALGIWVLARSADANTAAVS